MEEKKTHEKKNDEPSSKLDDRVNRSCTSRAAAIVTAAAVFPQPPASRSDSRLSCRCRSSSENTAKMLENSKNISTLGGTHDGAKRQRSTKKVKDDDDEGKKELREAERIL